MLIRLAVWKVILDYIQVDQVLVLSDTALRQNGSVDISRTGERR